MYCQPLGLLEDYHYGKMGHSLAAHCLSQDGLYLKRVMWLCLGCLYILFMFASSHYSLGCSVGVGGTDRLLRHSLVDDSGTTFLQDQKRFSPFSQKNK